MPRFARWLRYRLVIPVFRSRHSHEHTARGVAIGVFWGLTPSVGLQTIEILATWFLARKLLRRDSSLIQAMIWVWVNNPVTMIPLYYAFYVTGLWLVGDAGLAKGYQPFVDLWDANASAGWLTRISAIAAAIGVPLVIGSLPYALVGAGLSYRWTISVLRRRELRRRDRATLHVDPKPGASRE